MSQFPILSPALQLGFYQRLEEARKAHLLPALLKQVGQLDIGLLDKELLDLGQISDVRSSEYARFREYLASEIGI